MDPRRLLVFGTVIRCGSLGAAARELGWTQPAVSQHVRALELEARQPLVVRGSRGVLPTEAGRLLLAHADAVAARLRAAEAELAGLADARSGTVRLAVFPTAAATLVAAALAVLARDHPGVEVRLTDVEPPEALDLLAAGDVDAAIVFRYDDEPPAAGTPDGRVEHGPVEHGLVERGLAERGLAERGLVERGLVEHRLAGDGMRLVVPAGHPLATRRRPRLADAAGERWVGGCARCREHLVRACGRAGFVPDVRHSTDDYVIVQSLVAAGLAVALLPETALRVVTHPGVAVCEVDGAGRRSITLAHHPDAAGIPALRALHRALTAPGRG